MNKLVGRSLPLMYLRGVQEGTAILGGLNGSGAASAKVGDEWYVGCGVGDVVEKVKQVSGSELPRTRPVIVS